jgi:hypothetical protein
MSPYLRRIFWLAFGGLVGLIFLDLNFRDRSTSSLQIETIDDMYCVVYNWTKAEDLKLVFNKERAYKRLLNL